MIDHRPQEENVYCLSDELLTLWAEGLLSSSDKVKVEAHVSACAVCRELIKTIEHVKQNSRENAESSAPEELSMAARRLVKRNWETQIASILLRLTDGLYSAAETTGRVLLAPWLSPAVSMRAEEDMRQSSVVVETIYQHMRCTVESSRTTEDRHTLKASFCEINTDKPIEGTLFVLFDEREEIESQVSVGGKVVFEDLLPGSYRLMMNSPDGLQGHLDFHLIPS
jgi:hypothetical protein